MPACAVRKSRPGQTEAAAEAAGSWFSRIAACVDARDRLESAVERAEALMLGAARPAFVTVAAGAEAYAEVGATLSGARRTLTGWGPIRGASVNRKRPAFTGLRAPNRLPGTPAFARQGRPESPRWRGYRTPGAV